MSDWPVPSRLSSSSTLDSDVARLSEAVRSPGGWRGTLSLVLRRPASRRAPVLLRSGDLRHGGEERTGLGRGPGRDTKIVGYADVADEYSPVEQRRATSARRRRARRTGRSWRRWATGSSPSAPSSATIRSRCSLITSTVREQLRRVPQGRQRDRLGGRGQVVGQPHQPEGVDEGRVGGEVAEPSARERERLAHRPGDDEPRTALPAGSARWGSPGGRTPRRPRRRRRRRAPPRHTRPRRRRGPGRCRSGCSVSRGRRRGGRARAPARPRTRRVRSNGVPPCPRSPSTQVLPTEPLMIGCIE